MHSKKDILLVDSFTVLHAENKVDLLTKGAYFL